MLVAVDAASLMGVKGRLRFRIQIAVVVILGILIGGFS